MINDKLPKMWYGGDYNPEQWDEEIWKEDDRMFKLAGIDVATINVFSWALNQPEEDTYDFAWLDETIDRLYRNGVYVCLATSTAAHPAWMARKYPDILRVDYEGRKRRFGGRHNSCPNSPTYRKYAKLMASKLAERYKDHPAVLIWHVSNEYGGYCYCDNCAEAFRVWLKQRYGTLDALNKAWNTRFWGHTFYDWEDIVVPNALSEEWGGNRTNFQGISLDYRRFQSDSLLDCYKLERDELKRITPDIPVTTNLMGFYPELDYFKWAKEMDVVSWDNYPSLDTPFSFTAMTHALMRGLKSGQPFMLMEQTPSVQNWQPYNSAKRPGVMRLWSYQAVAHGADTVMFFQLRRSIGACEKYHGAVIEHVGHEHTRVFRECAELGKELQQLGERLLDARSDAKVAIMYDWENRWGIELSSGPTVALKYVSEVHKYYDALHQLHIQTDMISVEEDLSQYDVVIAPVMYMVKPGFAKRVEEFVSRGGTFLTTFFSGIVNENDIVTLGGYPGELRSLMGIWAEEIDALLPGQQNQMIIRGKHGELEGSYDCGILCDVIHAEGAEVVAEYGSDYYKGMPSLTVNRFGQGKAWYVASSPDAKFLQDLMKTICAEHGIQSVLDAPAGVEAARRVKDDKAFTFVLNHTAEAKTVPLGDAVYKDLLTGKEQQKQCEVPARGVMILEKL
ncbi:beta-galactosidase [Paenibacillus lactis]|uniref:Beta-galactosidase n=2 Tax=Paenibacillus lactis TaxID=228574 RepID=G4HKR0_9BACL|nr:beta-galactosidase [Paenibacillus lactis]EHB59600.1 Beta-galactosidase [Paenibacillus lactis 154]MBP1896839.1 beta-galactosidase [Paenibacillus lactis]GIO94810.1 beta-galactosidase [Paenibacillus lactis]HAF97873.1 beta-galactosidase [Paenibacillus lactis]